jgi:hypothetical protein
MKNIKELTNEERSITEINEIIKFIDENIKRGICNP